MDLRPASSTSGKMVMPGINDVHVHPILRGRTDLFKYHFLPTLSLGVLEVVRADAHKAKPGTSDRRRLLGINFTSTVLPRYAAGTGSKRARAIQCCSRDDTCTIDGSFTHSTHRHRCEHAESATTASSFAMKQHAPQFGFPVRSGHHGDQRHRGSKSLLTGGRRTGGRARWKS